MNTMTATTKKMKWTHSLNRFNSMNLDNKPVEYVYVANAFDKHHIIRKKLYFSHKS